MNEEAGMGGTVKPIMSGDNHFAMPHHFREPTCIHLSDPYQPMSACRICKDDPRLQAWRDYWDAHPELIPRSGCGRDHG